MNLDWPDAEEIALRLMEKYPDTDPLTVRFTDLRRWVCELAEFKGNPEASSEGILERIQMAWDSSLALISLSINSAPSSRTNSSGVSSNKINWESSLITGTDPTGSADTCLYLAKTESVISSVLLTST